MGDSGSNIGSNDYPDHDSQPQWKAEKSTNGPMTAEEVQKYCSTQKPMTPIAYHETISNMDALIRAGGFADCDYHSQLSRVDRDMKAMTVLCLKKPALKAKPEVKIRVIYMTQARQWTVFCMRGTGKDAATTPYFKKETRELPAVIREILNG